MFLFESIRTALALAWARIKEALQVLYLHVLY